MGGNYSVAIDLGGTIIKIGLILDSEIVRFTTISSDSVKGLSHMLPKAECTHKYVNICKSTCNKRSNYIVLKHH